MLVALLCVVGLAVAIYAFDKWYRRDYIEDFHKKNVFITGTDTGFGRKLALDLDKKGLTVYAGCYTNHGADNLRKEASKRMRIFQLDVTDRESIVKAKEYVEKDLLPNQGLWALVNNAGIAKGAYFDFTTIQDYRDVMDVNFYGAVEVIEVFMPLIKASRGRIVNLISIMGRCSVLSGPYSSSKFALQAYSDGLRRSMWPFQVKVSIIEPGFFKTNITHSKGISDDINQHWNQLSPQCKDQYGLENFEEGAKCIQDFILNPELSNFNTLGMVTKSIEHAIASKRPKDRYVVGLDAHLIYRPLSLLPDGVADMLIYIKQRKFIKKLADRIKAQ